MRRPRGRWCSRVTSPYARARKWAGSSTDRPSFCARRRITNSVTTLWKAPVFEPDRGCCAIRTAAQADFRAANLDFAVAVVICFSNGDSRKLDGVMAREPVLAAGGIVLRHEPTPLIAVVRLRKRDEWVLPKGKLDDGETPLAAAKREVLEETGHVVTVHEFLGTLVYEISGRSKVVHYWRMEARG